MHLQSGGSMLGFIVQRRKKTPLAGRAKGSFRRSVLRFRRKFLENGFFVSHISEHSEKLSVTVFSSNHR